PSASPLEGCARRSAWPNPARRQTYARRSGPGLALPHAAPSASRPTPARAPRRRTPSTPASVSARVPARQPTCLAGRSLTTRTRCPRSPSSLFPDTARPHRHAGWRQTPRAFQPAPPPVRSAAYRRVAFRLLPPRSSPRARGRASQEPPPPPFCLSVRFPASRAYDQSRHLQSAAPAILSHKTAGFITGVSWRLVGLISPGVAQIGCSAGKAAALQELKLDGCVQARQK